MSMRVSPPPPWSLAVTVTGAISSLESKFFRLSNPALILAGGNDPREAQPAAGGVRGLKIA